MAITDIISEEIETRDPNLEVARGGPEDFMTDDEMDPYQDPEFQQLLESLPTEQAEVLMQLIKEFKAMVAQGFEGEFEDFVKMKMSTAQGGPEDFMSEEEMIVPDEELQSMVPMGQQVAQGGRIGMGMGGAISHLQHYGMNTNDIIEIWLDFKNSGSGGSFHQYVLDTVNPPDDYAQGGRIGYQNAGPVGGIMDVVAEEQVERGPTTQELIIKWLNDRGLPITPENIQKAIMEMSREGQAPAMTRGQSPMPQMEAPRPPTGADYVPEELIGQDISEVVTPDVEEAVYSDEEMRDMKQRYIEQGGTLDKASWGIEDDVEDVGIMQTRDPIFYSDDEIIYTDDDKKEWFDKMKRLTEARGGLSPDSYLRLKDDKMKEGVDKGFISEEDYLGKWQMPFFGQGGENVTNRIDDYRNWAGLAQGGRPGYGLGSLVKSVFKGVKKGVKGLTKSIKKFAKSDLGKMALMYMATAGMANIGAGGSWASPFAKGTGWLRPSTVIGDFGKTGWGNIGKSFTNLGFGGDKLKSGQTLYKKIGVDPKALARTGVEEFLYSPVSSNPASFVSKLGQSFTKNPFPWIAGTAGLAGLYTAANPGKDNIDELMRNYKGEVGEWDQMLADIRAGQGVTPFATDNVLFPYPNYYQLAGGGRVAAQEGGLMDLGGLEKDYRAEGGFVPIGGEEKADDVPARLSRNEFVFTADAVRNAGGGDVDRGAEVMENVMTNLENGGSISEESQGLEGARDMFEVSERLSEVV